MGNMMIKTIVAAVASAVVIGASAQAGILVDPGLSSVLDVSTEVSPGPFESTDPSGWLTATPGLVNPGGISGPVDLTGYQVLIADVPQLAGIWQVLPVDSTSTDLYTLDVSDFSFLAGANPWEVAVTGISGAFSGGQRAPINDLAALNLGSVGTALASYGLGDSGGASASFIYNGYDYLLVTAYATGGTVAFNSIDITAIPEPSTFVLGGILFVATATMIRRKGKATA